MKQFGFFQNLPLKTLNVLTQKFEFRGKMFSRAMHIKGILRTRFALAKKTPNKEGDAFDNNPINQEHAPAWLGRGADDGTRCFTHMA